MARPLNHNHLYYFWLAAKHRSISAAARELGVAQPTVSAQIRTLEDELDVALFKRRAREIDLTDAGATVFRYADEMFRLSAQIPTALSGARTDGIREITIGVADYVPKPISYRVLSPLIRHDPPLRLVCREGPMPHLLAELALYKLDAVLSDRAHDGGNSSVLSSHPVCETAIGIFARSTLARKLRKDFPKSLDGAPMFLPSIGSMLRAALDSWFEANEVRPEVIAEFDDRAALKLFGASGVAAFPAASMIEQEVRAQYGVDRIGFARGLRETYYLITARRRVRHPGVETLLGGPMLRLRAGEG
ncbi:MAG: LysR family transcriptional regulator [Phycisphaerae bacterium]|nr:LysR family transcriptional regulator [Phycisphaerae bacterium]